jgi:hypothetical protein
MRTNYWFEISLVWLVVVFVGFLIVIFY